MIVNVLVFDGKVEVKHPLAVIVFLLVDVGVLAEVGYAVPLRLPLLIVVIGQQLLLEAIINLRMHLLLISMNHSLRKSLEILIRICV